MSISTEQAAEALFSTANLYTSLNYAVIPVFGDAAPDRAKVAALSWKEFQSRRPSALELRRWFLEQHFGGLAIVTGRISRLLVLDFDDAALITKFEQRFPHLTSTRIVASAGRGTPHYYYALPPSLSLSSHHAAGVDLLADGAYVLAPPTTIAGKNYRVRRGGLPLLLTERDAARLVDFVREQAARTPAPVPPLASAVDHPPAIIAAAPPAAAIPDRPRPQLTSAQLITNYQHLAPRIGRNQALFQQALAARDAGWSPSLTLLALGDRHVAQPAGMSHKSETPAQRQREAQRTIASAFSRPPRRAQFPAKLPALPGPLREALLQRGEVALLRVLDALTMQSVAPGTLLTEKAIVTALAGSIGRHSILKALRATLPDGQPIFVPQHPSPATPSPADAAIAVTAFPEQTMLFVGETEPNKKRGRPPQQYHMPDPAALCQALKLPCIPGDALQPDDLASVRRYRQGVHRGLIARRPGLYARDWLANRLGITARSLQRYRQDARICIKPVFREYAITWHTLNMIPDPAPNGGVFLEDDTGRRYPALRPLAQKLLKQRRKLRCLYQCENYYSLAEAAISAAPAALPTPLKPALKPLPAAPLTVVTPLPAARPPLVLPAEPLKLITTDNSLRIAMPPVPPADKAPPARYYRRPLPDAAHEALAQQVYTALRACVPAEGPKTGYTSLAVTRRLVDRYRPRLVERALATLRQRRHLRNPAGFMCTWLRGAARAAHHTCTPNAAAL